MTNYNYHNSIVLDKAITLKVNNIKLGFEETYNLLKVANENGTMDILFQQLMEASERSCHE
jgi:hypothetical protein